MDAEEDVAGNDKWEELGPSVGEIWFFAGWQEEVREIDSIELRGRHVEEGNLNCI